MQHDAALWVSLIVVWVNSVHRETRIYIYREREETRSRQTSREGPANGRGSLGGAGGKAHHTDHLNRDETIVLGIMAVDIAQRLLGGEGCDQAHRSCSGRSDGAVSHSKHRLGVGGGSADIGSELHTLPARDAGQPGLAAVQHLIRWQDDCVALLYKWQETAGH